VRSRSNPLVKRLRALKQRADPAGGLMLLEGPKLLFEALRAGIELVELAFAARLEGAPQLQPLWAEVARRGLPARTVDDALIDALSETEVSQGVLALARRPAFEEARLFAAPEPLLIVLVGVQNPGNLGGLLRTAEAAGAHGAILTAGCADPFAWKALRGAMGSAFRLPLALGWSVGESVARLRARGLRLGASDAAGARAYAEADLRGPLALLFGSEGAGLPSDVTAQADLRLTIPMAGAVESLNVGVAAGVLLFEIARQRRLDPRRETSAAPWETRRPKSPRRVQGLGGREPPA
jgi:TrmH family RNA methyltransferase